MCRQIIFRLQCAASWKRLRTTALCSICIYALFLYFSMWVKNCRLFEKNHLQYNWIFLDVGTVKIKQGIQFCSGERWNIWEYIFGRKRGREKLKWKCQILTDISFFLLFKFLFYRSEISPLEGSFFIFKLFCYYLYVIKCYKNVVCVEQLPIRCLITGLS